jgi:nitrogen fixation protein FixH
MTRAFTGRDMSFLMIAFFAVVISVNVLMAVIASESWTGLVVANSYVASQQFNERTEELERSAAMNVHARLAYKDGEIALRLHDSSGTLVKAKGIVLRIGRTVHDSEDRSLPLSCGPDGTCRAQAELGPGFWTGEVEAELADFGRWYRAVRLVVREGP